MSVKAGQAQSWLKSNYSKLLLLLALLFLIGSSMYLFVNVDGISETLAKHGRLHYEVQPDQKVSSIDIDAYDNALKALQSPYQSTQQVKRMMVSELRVACVHCGKPIPFNALVCPFCKEDQPPVMNPEEVDSDGDGMPDKYEQRLGLNALYHGDAIEDIDGDGFTNIEEFNARTNPTNAESAPTPAAKLRVLRVGTNPFKLRFVGIQTLPNGDRFQLNLKTLTRSYFVKIGDEVDGFTVARYNPDDAEGPMLLLEKDNKMIRLIKGKAITQYELFANLVFLINREVFRVKVGDAVTLKGVEYKVVDIKRDRIFIKDVKSGQEYAIAPITDAERAALRAGVGGASGDGRALPFSAEQVESLPFSNQ